MNDMLSTIRAGQKRMMELLKDIHSRRPKCPASLCGDHTMVEYRSEAKKVCIDCGYTEDLRIKWK